MHKNTKIKAKTASRISPESARVEEIKEYELGQHKVINITFETSRQSGRDDIYELENGYLFMYHILHLHNVL